jgi:hypothetical protein
MLGRREGPMMVGWSKPDRVVAWWVGRSKESFGAHLLYLCRDRCAYYSTHGQTSCCWDDKVNKAK